MDLRDEFAIKVLSNSGRTFKSICDEYTISRTTGYKWILRYKLEGYRGLKDRPRRPESSPNKLRACPKTAPRPSGRELPSRPVNKKRNNFLL
ncbi:MAG: helix-turn-helix domain-containing protein [Leptospira sp.]|nr:helix-turn-helix domain-containing protein [Leptospira sp.]